ncbi:protein FAR-RED IMPAIRED RESPONSE 1-like [Chenopodium quinoa]|uniref:protein FAR-RED IMPAIRED RESPONSE 1-like n=1 Tax=Chenopodium quinoa TaxID=63459 RepID=UPI000B77F2AA|nr:protein FAR-RED IMPAIRED RESPONSE 1-like [Chenopodium quinoa]
MRNHLVDILGVDLAEALREEEGHGCARRELRFDSENSILEELMLVLQVTFGAIDAGIGGVGNDDDDDAVCGNEEGFQSEHGYREGDEEEIEEGSEDDGDEWGSDSEGEEGWSDSEEVEEEEGGEDGGAVAESSTFITPKKNPVLVSTVFGVEEEVPAPSVGMVFGSWDEVDSYFWSYARQKGFGIVRAVAGFDKVKSDVGDGTFCKQKRNAKWTCDCYGRPSRKRKVDVLKEGLLHDEETVVKRKTKKCGCEVELYASVDEGGNWVVRRVHLEQKGHRVTPGKSKDVTMFRKHELMSKNGHLVNRVFAEKQRLELTEGDENGMIEYFNKMSADNQIFFHLCRFGKDGALQDVVWVDARCRAAYEEFGDVVCFDSTYLTNKFHLPYALFVGVNHHEQSILFGCALISRETAETYEWVLRTWLHCMGGKAPTSILTDQDPAIRKAVHITMRDTCHRWCIWHILQKFWKYVGKHEQYDAVKDEFENIIYGSLDAEEFVARWIDAMEYYELQENSLFEEREMWIPVYLKHLFWARMKTTQRSESFNHFFKGYVDKNTTLSEFVLRYCDAMTIRAEAERVADSNTIRYMRHLKTDFCL